MPNILQCWTFSEQKIEPPKTYPIGRLDRDTTGLLLLTDNGPLGFQLLHPQYHIEKEYAVTVNGPLEATHIDRFQDGITFLDGTRCKPAKLEILSSSPEEARPWSPCLRGNSIR